MLPPMAFVWAFPARTLLAIESWVLLCKILILIHWKSSFAYLISAFLLRIAMAKLCQLGKCRRQQRCWGCGDSCVSAGPLQPAPASPSYASVRASAVGQGSKCLNGHNPPLPVAFLYEWQKERGLSNAKKSHCHEYSCGFLSMLGVCLHVLCVRFWLNAPANEFLRKTGESVLSNGNFKIVIIYCFCHHCI